MNFEQETQPNKKHEARVFRHSIPHYQLDEGICQSENPEMKPEAKNQWFDTDLTSEGKILARVEAEKYFDTLDPKTDALFFVSSDLVRAAETARIFMDVAKERGFEIIKPRGNHPANQGYRNKAEEIGEGYIRKINCLTLDHLENMLREKVFISKVDYVRDVVAYPENISQETLEKWEKARKIIESDDKGSWGDNYYAHSEEISKIFSNVKSAREVYNKKFLKMVELVEFAAKKIREKNPQKNIKILGFSHENAFIYFLNMIYGESIKNCESVGFILPENGEGQLIVSAKGQSHSIDEIQERIRESEFKKELNI